MHLRTWALSAAAFLLITVFTASSVQTDLARGGLTTPWWAIFRSMLPSAVLWMLVSPLLVELARRRPVAAPHRARHVALHGGVGAVWIACSTVTATALAAIWRGWPADGLLAWSTYAPSGVLTDGLIVIALVVLGTQLHTRDRAERAERERAQLAAENNRLQALLARTELHALRARLQPHFLFNALGAVGTLVRRGDEAAAISMLAGLGDLLRAAVQSERQPLVPLERELALARQYLEVQQVRFGAALTWSIEASEAARAVFVPCLILQPVLENALLHGIEKSSRRGHVRIEAHTADGALNVVIANDGPGLPPAFDLDRDAGEGLRLTVDRLRLLSGLPLLALDDTENGVRASFRIPLGLAARCAS